MIAKNVLYKEVQALPLAERVRLVDAIYHSFAKEDKDIERAWIKESKSRYKAIKDGKMAIIPAEKIFGRL